MAKKTNQKKNPAEEIAEKIARAEARIAADRLRVEKLRAEKKKKEEEEAAKANLPNSLWPAIHKSLASISSLCAPEHRPTLNCIAIYENEILVSNGNIAVRRKITNEEKKIAGEFPLSESLAKLVSEKPKYPILIPSDIFNKAISNVKKSPFRGVETLKVMQDENGFMLVSNDLEKEIITRVRNVVGDYPREALLKFIPDDKELPIFETTFDAELLLKLASEISHDKKSVNLKFYKNSDANTPREIIVVDNLDKEKATKDIERVGIFMPLRK